MLEEEDIEPDSSSDDDEGSDEFVGDVMQHEGLTASP